MSALATLQDRWLGIWSGLASRDQRALRIGGVLLAVLLPIALAWAIRDSLAERSARLDGSRALATMAGQRIAARLAAGVDLSPSSAGAGTADSALLQTRVMRLVERAGLATATTVEPAAQAAQVRLALRDAPFDAVTMLLGALARWEG
ncbi:MAG: type II secretion system protein GspM, partial [Planctomycetota bacterium]